MNARQALLALILVTALLLTVVGALMPDTVAALAALGGGVLWLALELRSQRDFGTIFFLIFVGIAVLGSLKDVPAPLILLALSGALAAWDLSMFQARTAALEAGAARAALERNHLRKLGVTAGIGFAAALVPVVAQISISFVVLLLALLLTVIALRGSVSWLRGEREKR